MAKKVVQLYDKYKSTTKVFPYIIGDSILPDAMEKIKKEVGYETPKIIIGETQMISDDTLQLTDEQYTELLKNSIVGITLPNNVEVLYFVKVADTPEQYMTFNTGLLYDIDNFILWEISINYETKIATLEVFTVPTGAGGKQLYQHNIDFVRSGWDIHCPIKIITDKETAFTKETFLSWLSNNSYGVSNPYQVSGYIWVDTTQYQVKGVYPYNSDIAIQYCSGKNATAFNSNVNIDITDNVNLI